MKHLRRTGGPLHAPAETNLTFFDGHVTGDVITLMSADDRRKTGGRL